MARIRHRPTILVDLGDDGEIRITTPKNVAGSHAVVVITFPITTGLDMEWLARQIAAVGEPAETLEVFATGAGAHHLAPAIDRALVQAAAWRAEDAAGVERYADTWGGLVA